MALLIDSRVHNRVLLEQHVVAYLATLPDSERWKDMFQSSVGKVIIDILCGISELNFYKGDVRQREIYLYTGASEESIYLLADILGYNVNRKAAAEGKVTVSFSSPTPSQIIIPDGYAIYSGDTPLVVVGNFTIPAGSTSYEINVAQGEFNYLLFTSTPGETYYYGGEAVSAESLIGATFERLVVEEGFEVENAAVYSSRISIFSCTADSQNNLTVLSTIPWYRNVWSLDSSSVLLKTYYEGGVVILFGDDSFGKKITSSDLILVKYLKTLGAEATITINTDLDDIVLDTIGGSVVATVKVSETVSGGSDEDDIEKVRTVVAGYFSAQDRAVTLNDWYYVLLSYQGIHEVQVRKNSTLCCTVDIVLVTETMTSEGHYDWTNPNLYWTAAKEATLLDYLEGYKMISTNVLVDDPVPKDFQINIQVTLSSESVDTDDLRTDIRTAVKAYCYELGLTFYPEKIITDATNLNQYVTKVIITQIKIDAVTQSDPYASIALSWAQYFRVMDANIAISFIVSTD